MVTQVAAVEGRVSINMVMVEESFEMAEVVVVGYGVQEKESLVSAIDQVSGERIKGMGVTNISSALSGVSPGLVSVSSSGQPGNDGSELYIRGRSSINDDHASASDFLILRRQRLIRTLTLKLPRAAEVFGGGTPRQGADKNCDSILLMVPLVKLVFETDFLVKW